MKHSFSKNKSIPKFFQRYEERINFALRKEYEKLHGNIYDTHKYYMGWTDENGKKINAIGGKRLRPNLVLLGAEAADGDIELAIPFAVAIELIHNFSLIHDDIEDMDELRHHRATLWKLWGIPGAIISGNAMLKIADLATNKKIKINEKIKLEASHILSSRYLTMMEGQFLDIDFESKLEITIDEYLDMIQRKTGALIEASLHIGAIVGQKNLSMNDQKIESIKIIGKEFGKIFQIKDDMLGIWGDEKTGKPVGADIIKKKKSLPILHAINYAKGSNKKQIKNLFIKKRNLHNEEIKIILRIMEELRTSEYCENLLNSTWENCHQEIISSNINEKIKLELIELGKFLLTRNV
ncbi:MAG: polyprenyl synthetase family protein [SAR202 cluster bacterium]|nr:polyprenyl synthetase family protein [SAR202 cluster bacterium]|tara:strand:+ start:8229 stop:9284 length:1056 start_codon:yes stop_codon:yes gene_type:complete